MGSVRNLKGRKPKKAVDIELLGDKQYTYRELADMLEVTTQGVRLMIADGRIPEKNLKPAKVGAKKKTDATALKLGELYSKKEAREKLKVAPQTLERMIADDILRLVIISDVEFVKRVENGKG